MGCLRERRLAGCVVWLGVTVVWLGAWPRAVFWCSPAFSSRLGTGFATERNEKRSAHRETVSYGHFDRARWLATALCTRGSGSTFHAEPCLAPSAS